MLGEIERQQRPHAVIAEPLPHLGGEQPRELARMAEPGLLVGGIGACLKRAKTVLRRLAYRPSALSPCAAAQRRDPNGQIRACEADCCRRRARCYAPASMLNDRSSILSLLETRRSAKPRDLVGPGPTPSELRAHPDHRRAHARPRQAPPVALRHRRPTTSATPSPRCSSRRWPSDDPDAPPAQHREGGRVRPLCRAARRARLGAGRGPQDPGLGAGTVLRRRRHEPAARRPRARLCRRLGDRLARLFASASAPPSAARASGSPASSSSATPAASSRSGRGPTRRRSWKPWQPPKLLSFRLELSAIRCIMTA